MSFRNPSKYALMSFRLMSFPCTPHKVWLTDDDDDDDDDDDSIIPIYEPQKAVV